MSNLEQVEIWKPIPNYGGYYEASSLGNIRSVERIVNGFSAKAGRPATLKRKSKVLKQHKVGRGYLSVCIAVDGNIGTVRVHKLVMLAFVGPCPTGMQICHNNGNPSDNRIQNLRYDTPKNNQMDRDAHGTALRGEMVKTAKFTAEEVKAMKSGIDFRKANEIFGVSKTQYFRIIKGDSWAHVHV